MNKIADLKGLEEDNNKKNWELGKNEIKLKFN
jgi:hypothetical protein